MNQIFINLPVTELEKSTNLYSNMGFTINPNFSDDSAKCLVFSDSIYLMIMTIERFKTFTNRQITNTKNSLSAIYALSVENLEKVNALADGAIKVGASEPKPLQDHGFMQLRTIEDFDGHTWEIFYMDMSKLPQQ